ncbi:hypothetical protein ACETAC_07385 [Aceticella autotrophica]|uniref:Uncharacterized protein n=1 Tax=Aceticella autotrophica TaxID=2755338 RepID=A0A975AUJ8_9THEO|nr:hypothetical protein [Aceticella autotrophica]QSZ26717.1 hypothetical protein ACETAC_07385 [Aceticella autotrophica]
MSPAIDAIKESLKWGDITVVATDSDIADNNRTIKEKIADIKQRTTKSVIWMHFGEENSLQNIVNNNKDNIIPMIIDSRKNKVAIKNYKKGVSI